MTSPDGLLPRDENGNHIRQACQQQQCIRWCSGGSCPTVGGTRNYGTHQFGASLSLCASSNVGLNVDYVRTTGPCSIAPGSSTVVMGFTSGTCYFKAGNSGDFNFAQAWIFGSISVVGLTQQSIVVNWNPPTTATFGDGGFYDTSASSNAPLATVTRTSGSSSVCYLDGCCRVRWTNSGTCVIHFDSGPLPGYTAANRVTRSFDVAKRSATIIYGTLPTNAVYLGPQKTIDVSTTSGAAVFLVASGACSIVSGTTVQFSGIPGTCSLTANAPATSNFNAPSSQSTSFSVSKASQSITNYPGNPSGPSVGGSMTFAPGASSSLSVTRGASGGCSYSNGVVSFDSASTCSLSATQDGNVYYFAAPLRSSSFDISKRSQIVDVSTPSGTARIGDSYTAVGSSNRGYTSGYSFAASGSCTISGSTVTFTTPAGSACTVTASHPGDALTLSDSGSRSITVYKGTQSVSLPSAPSSPLVGTSYTVTASASSGLAISSYSVSGSGCLLSGFDTVVFTAASAGNNCFVSATQGGSLSFEAATSEARSISVNKGTHSLSWNSGVPGTRFVGGTGYTPFATSSRSLGINYSASPPSVCGISAGTVNFVGIGTCTITASSSGGSNYVDATPITRMAQVDRGSQTVQFVSTGFPAELNGPTYTPQASASSGLAPVLSSDTTTICTVSGGTVSFPSTGNCVLRLSQPGDTNWLAASPQVTQTVPVGLRTQTITITSTKPVNPKLGVAGPYTVQATSDSGLAVVFSTASTGVCTSSGTNGRTITFIGQGACVVNADQPGDSEWGIAATKSETINIQRGDHTITIQGPAPAATVDGTPYTPTATSSISSLTSTITLSTSTPNVCTMDGNGAVSFQAVGDCFIQASNPQTNNYEASTATPQRVVVGRGAQSTTITSTKPGGAQVQGDIYQATATASSGLPPTIVVTTGTICAIDGQNRVTFLKAGFCTLRADQGGNANYLAAAVRDTQTFEVFKGTQVIGFTSDPTSVSPKVASTPYPVAATATPSGLPVSFAIVQATANVCSISGKSVTFQARGACTIMGTQGGDNDWNAAAAEEQTFQVAGGDQSITFDQPIPTNPVVDGPTYTPKSTSTVGLTTTHSVDPATQMRCVIENGVVRFIKAGSCRVFADQGGDANYNPAPQKVVALTVGKGTQTLRFDSAAPTSATVDGTLYAIVATSNAPGAAVNLAVAPASATVCSLTGTSVTFTSSGSCTIEATADTTDDYLAAAKVTQSFTVAKANQQLDFSSFPASPIVNGTVYTPVVTSTAGLTPVLSIDPSTAARCTFNSGAGTVSFQKAGPCVINANQAGDVAYNAAPQAQQTLNVGRTTQVLSFMSQEPSPDKFFIGSLYEPAAVSSRGLPVSIRVSLESVSRCNYQDGLVFARTPGVCELIAVQEGTSDVEPATPVVQDFNVTMFAQTNATIPLEQLTGCATRVDCAVASSGILGPQYAAEVAAVQKVEQVVRDAEQCDNDQWLNPCNVERISQLASLNAERVENLDTLLKQVDAFGASCQTGYCNETLRFVQSTYSEVILAAASTCASPKCLEYSSMQKRAFVEIVDQTGQLNLERLRYDANVHAEQLQLLTIDTLEYAACQDDACRARVAVSKTNVTFAIQGYIAQALGYGFRLNVNATTASRSSQSALVSPLVEKINRNFTRCVFSPVCTFAEFNLIRRQKRAGEQFFRLYAKRLIELQAACTTEACRTSVANEQAVNERSVYLMNDYVPASLCIPGFVFYSLLILAVAAVGVLGFLWRTFFGKELFWMVLAGIVLTSVFRIAMFGVGLRGDGTVSLTFVVLDKMASLFFALTILVFVYMWARAISIMAEAPTVVQYILGGTTIAISCAVAAVSIVYAVRISRDFVSSFYGEYVYDRAEIILASFTLALITVLFVFVLIVGVKLGALRGNMSEALEAKADEKLRNLKLIAIAIGILVALLTMRLALVILRNFPSADSNVLGYTIFYVVATLFPEVFSCIVMIGLVLFTFYQSKHVSYDGRSSSTFKSSLKTNSSYQCTADATELSQMRYEV